MPDPSELETLRRYEAPRNTVFWHAGRGKWLYISDTMGVMYYDRKRGWIRQQQGVPLYYDHYLGWVRVPPASSRVQGFYL